MSDKDASFDSKCLELARYFLEDFDGRGSHLRAVMIQQRKEELAKAIQDAIENMFAMWDLSLGDPEPKAR